MSTAQEAGEMKQAGLEALSSSSGNFEKFSI